MKDKQSCHLILSGGGIRGFAHVGVYKALVEQGYVITSISGTSVGALIGAMIASCLSPYEIEKICTEKSLRQYVDLNFSNWGGFFSLKKVVTLLQEATHADDIKDLKLPLTICITDLLTQQPFYYNQGNLKEIVSGSCAIPGVFDPVSYDNKVMIDGGITDNFPFEGIQHDDQYVIGVHVNPIPVLKDYTIKDVSKIAIEIMVGRAIRDHKKQCDIFIEPTALVDINQSLFVDPSEIIALGYQYALSVLGSDQKTT